MAWILTLTMIHVSSIDTFEVSGFRSLEECQKTGQAWLAQVHRREIDADVSYFRCDAHHKAR